MATKRKPKLKTKSKARPKPRPAPRPDPRDDPAALTQPLTPRGLDAQVGAATALWAQPALAELLGRRAQSQQMQANIPAWFADYRAALARATQQTGAGYAAAAAGSQQATNSMTQLAAQQDAAQQQSMQQDAALRGAQVDPALAALAARANLARQATGDVQTRLTLGLGAANTAYRSAQEVVGAGQQLTAHQRESNINRRTDLDAANLATQTGRYAEGKRQELIDKEHTKQLERKAFNLNVSKAQADAANEAASIQQRREAAKARERAAAAQRAVSRRNTRDRLRVTQSENATNRAFQAREKAADRAAARERARITGAGGVTPAERRQRNDAVARANNLRNTAVQTARSAARTQRFRSMPLPKQRDLLRALLKDELGDAPPEVIDYAMAAALGSKAGVTPRGGKSAARRYYDYLKELAAGRRRK